MAGAIIDAPLPEWIVTWADGVIWRVCEVKLGVEKAASAERGCVEMATLTAAAAAAAVTDANTLAFLLR